MTGSKFKACLLTTSVIRWRTLKCLPTTWRKRRTIITTNKNTTSMERTRRINKNIMVGWNIWNHKKSIIAFLYKSLQCMNTKFNCVLIAFSTTFLRKIGRNVWRWNVKRTDHFSFLNNAADWTIKGVLSVKPKALLLYK